MMKVEDRGDGEEGRDGPEKCAGKWEDSDDRFSAEGTGPGGGWGWGRW